MKIYFDGSFQGFLSVLYKVFGYRDTEWFLEVWNRENGELFRPESFIETHPERARKAWNRLNRMDPVFARNVFYAFHQCLIQGNCSDLIAVVRAAIQERQKSVHPGNRSQVRLDRWATQARMRARRDIHQVSWHRLSNSLQFAFISKVQVPLTLFMHVLNTTQYGNNYVCVFPGESMVVARNFSHAHHWVLPLNQGDVRKFELKDSSDLSSIWDTLCDSPGFTDYFSLSGRLRPKGLQYDLAS